MSPQRGPLLLRITAVWFAVYAALHTYGAMYADLHEAVPLKQALFAAMRSYKETLPGATRSYMDFYMAFGLMASWTLLLFAILSWQLASLSRTQPAVARPLVLTLFVISIPMTILIWTHVFAIPALFSTVATVLLGLSYYALPPSGRSVAR